MTTVEMCGGQFNDREQVVAAEVPEGLSSAALVPRRAPSRRGPACTSPACESREEILLVLAGREWTDSTGAVARQLGASEPPVPSATLARLLASSLEQPRRSVTCSRTPGPSSPPG